MCLDLKASGAAELFRQLVGAADVVIENFSANTLKNMGFGFDVLYEANPKIVYVSMPGYGVSGPMSDRVAFGPTAEVYSGYSNLFGYGPGDPRNTGIAMLDPICGLHATAAVLTALLSSPGSFWELSLHESGVGYNGPWLIDQQLAHHGAAQAPQCRGHQHPQMAPHGVYRCQGEDAWLAIACADDRQWQALCNLLPELEVDWSLAQRQSHSGEIDERLATWCAAHTRQQAVSSLQAAGVAAGEVQRSSEVLADPQAAAGNFFLNYEPSGVAMPGCPIRYPGVNQQAFTPCPSLGAHNLDVLHQWLNLSEQEVQQLANSGLLATQPPS